LKLRRNRSPPELREEESDEKEDQSDHREGKKNREIRESQREAKAEGTLDLLQRKVVYQGEKRKSFNPFPPGGEKEGKVFLTHQPKGDCNFSSTTLKKNRNRIGGKIK